jgi:hypothetical protein
VSIPPTNPKIYHITHVDNLSSIVAAGCIGSDAQRISQGLVNTNIGMTEIKRRRMALEVGCHPGTKVGEYVPFYFCPRSIMLFLIYRGNHPELSYRGGQSPIVHLEADFNTVVQWAEANDRRWAFSKSNAGAYYTEFFDRLDQLNKIDWAAVAALDFRDSIIKEGKQAEFLLFDDFPWYLIKWIGVIDQQMVEQVTPIVRQAVYQPAVSIQRGWYY